MVVREICGGGQDESQQTKSFSTHVPICHGGSQIKNEDVPSFFFFPARPLACILGFIFKMYKPVEAGFLIYQRIITARRKTSLIWAAQTRWWESDTNNTCRESIWVALAHTTCL